MYEAKEDKVLPPGAWHLWRGGQKPLVFFACPTCGEIAMLDHEIAVDGTVTPSVECAKPGCFHDMVKLLGWTPVPLAE